MHHQKGEEISKRSLKLPNVLESGCLLFIIVPLACALSSCNKDNDYKNPTSAIPIKSEGESPSFLFGDEALASNADADFEVFFFDINEAISSDGMSYSDIFQGTLPSDCYLIKSGDVEVLVDCGMYLNIAPVNYDHVMNDVIVPKLSKLVVGDLDYVIATHGDFDHISGFHYPRSSSTGLFEKIANQEVNFKIGTFIDFDSQMVRYYSSTYYDTEDKAQLYGTDVYRSYCTKRDELVENGFINNYASTSYLFGKESIEKAFGESEVPSIMERYQLAKPTMSDKKAEYAHTFPDDIEAMDDETLKKELDEDSYKKLSVEGCRTIRSDFGSLAKTDDGESLVYDIPLNEKVTLRILYNWYYNHLVKGSFGNSLPGKTITLYDGKTTNSQNGNLANNVSVALEVVSSSAKFLAMGDMGGSGEEGIVEYYSSSNVLNGITAYKASHHGSTDNNENYHILSNYGASLIYIPTVLLKPRTKLSGDDPLFSRLHGQAITGDQFFYNAQQVSNNPIILASETIIYSEKMKWFCFTPFYGDVHVSFYQNEFEYAYSYGGEVTCYIDQDEPNFAFSTYDDATRYSLQETPWYEKMGFAAFQGEEE